MLGWGTAGAGQKPPSGTIKPPSTTTAPRSPDLVVRDHERTRAGAGWTAVRRGSGLRAATRAGRRLERSSDGAVRRLGLVLGVEERAGSESLRLRHRCPVTIIDAPERHPGARRHRETARGHPREQLRLP